MRTVPASGASSPASMSSSVVLPDPLGPTSAVTAPAGTSMSAWSTATTEPKVRRTPRAAIPPSGVLVMRGP